MTQQRTPVDEIFYPDLGPQSGWKHPGDPVAEREHRRGSRAVEEAGAPPKVRAMTDEELAAGERAFAERLAAQATGSAPFWR